MGVEWGRGWVGGKKAPLPVFPSKRLAKEELAKTTFWLLVLTLLVSLLWNYKTIPSASPKLLNLNQDHVSKKYFFWPNPHKMEVMTTSLTEMLELPHFGHTTTFTIQFNYGRKFCWWRHRHKLWRHNLYFKIPLFQEGLE